jgi:hypothetical protein
MHDMLIAIAFLAMVLLPCIVASRAGSTESDPD